MKLMIRIVVLLWVAYLALAAIDVARSHDWPLVMIYTAAASLSWEGAWR